MFQASELPWTQKWLHNDLATSVVDQIADFFGLEVPLLDVRFFLVNGLLQTAWKSCAKYFFVKFNRKAGDMNLFRKGAGQRWWTPRRICIWFIDANRYSMKEECHKRPDTGVLWRSLDFSDKSRWNGHINTPCRMIGSFQNVVHGGLSLQKETVNESKLGCFEQSSFLQTKMDADMINGVLGIKRGNLYNHQNLGFNNMTLPSRDRLEIEWSFWISLIHLQLRYHTQGWFSCDAVFLEEPTFWGLGRCHLATWKMFFLPQNWTLENLAKTSWSCFFWRDGGRMLGNKCMAISETGVWNLRIFWVAVTVGMWLKHGAAKGKGPTNWLF